MASVELTCLPYNHSIVDDDFPPLKRGDFAYDYLGIRRPAPLTLYFRNKKMRAKFMAFINRELGKGNIKP